MRDKLRQIGLGGAGVLLLLGLAWAPTASAQNTNAGPPPFMGRGMRGGPPQGGPMGLLPPALGRLGLTDVQRDQVKTIVDGHQDELRGLLDRQRTARTALDAAVTAPELNEAAVRARAADLAKVEADMAVARAHVFADVFHVLTPDQQDRLKQLETARSERQRPGPGSRRGPRGRGPQGPPPPDGPPL